MLETVKNAMYTIGDSTSDLAKRFGSETADLAKRVGSGTADLAKRVGPKRAIIGLAIAGVVIGGSILLVRYLRARKEDLPFEGAEDQPHGRHAKRSAKRGTDAHYSH
jgi:hypothetical protein